MMVCLYSYIYILYTKVVIKRERRPCVAIHNIHVLEESIAPMLPHSRAPRVYDDNAAGWAAGKTNDAATTMLNFGVYAIMVFVHFDCVCAESSFLHTSVLLTFQWNIVYIV